VNDTVPGIERIFRELLMRRSGEERLRMGAEMFEAARAIVLASLPPLGAPERRARLFLRLYGSDFAQPERDRILEALAALPEEGRGTN
jgi:hypothetical protein